ncbi:MAG: hypothetical protein M1827_007453 [Pycnora praestabilis]|nr:MAG: hypothetical protein M1827_007453 [Pycnora praestabilis]
MGLIANPVIPDEDCTLSTCSLLQAHLQYVPSLPGNAIYAAIFTLLIVCQTGFGIRYKTWGFMGGMFGGLILEIIGYIARIRMHFNPFTKSPFLMYLICLTIGPAFLSAAIYLCLARAVPIYGEGLSRIRPRTYTIIFISCDFLSLLLQAAGGAIASTANTNADDLMGQHIMIAGLSCQVVSLLIFIILCAEFASRVYKNQNDMDPRFASLRSSFKFKAFLISLGIATLTIFIRSSFRVAELSGGFHGALANQQVTFMILEGAMIVIATTSLTIFHPGFAFQGHWDSVNFSLRGRKNERDGGSVGGESGGEETELEKLKTLEPVEREV